MIITSHPRLVLDRICVTHIPPPSSSSFSPLSPGTTIDYQNNKKTVENNGRGKQICLNIYIDNICAIINTNVFKRDKREIINTNEMLIILRYLHITI